MKNMQLHKNWYLLLFLYHSAFTFFTYFYFIENSGDAAYYWMQHNGRNYFCWEIPSMWNSIFFVILNYPFSKILSLPIWFGFVLHSLIGFYAVYRFYKLALLLLPTTNNFFWNIVLKVSVLLPNLHFWTANLGKESLVFLSLVIFFENIFKKNYLSITQISVILFLLLIRPHIAFFLVVSWLLVSILNNKTNRKYRLLFTVSLSVISILFFLYVLQVTHIKLDFYKISAYNNFALESFRHANTYVPMTTYSQLERLFVFLYLPLQFNFNQTLFYTIFSLENLLFLLSSVFIIYVFIFNFKKINFDDVERVILIFTIISTLFFIQRYSCYGIFARTKIMFIPFLYIVFIKVGYYSLNNEKDK